MGSLLKILFLSLFLCPSTAPKIKKKNYLCGAVRGRNTQCGLQRERAQ